MADSSCENRGEKNRAIDILLENCKLEEVEELLREEEINKAYNEGKYFVVKENNEFTSKEKYFMIENFEYNGSNITIYNSLKELETEINETTIIKGKKLKVSLKIKE
jgi:hypothetical protein